MPASSLVERDFCELDPTSGKYSLGFALVRLADIRRRQTKVHDVAIPIMRDIRNELFKHILDQSAGFFAQRTTGQLMSRVTNDVTQIQQAVSETAPDLIREGLALIGFAALLVYYDARLALVVLTAPHGLVPQVARMAMPEWQRWRHG